MKILVTNDDGYGAEGLKLLTEFALEITDDVWVVAPDTNQSGTGHSITIKQPLRLNQQSYQHYSVSGTPTDCVMLACGHLLKDSLPDLILSGINHGSNMAEDLSYSGTVAAAMEGTLLGIKSVALSMNFKFRENIKWDTARLCLSNVKDLILNGPVKKDSFMNINFPDCNHSELQGICITKQGIRDTKDMMHVCEDPREEKYFWHGSAMYRFEDHPNINDQDSDLSAIYSNYISINPVKLDFTDEHYGQQLKEYCMINQMIKRQIYA
ncbi:MAG: 5'/3'-nucleotidase SurE [Candidatus Puniceispirillum sp.]|nr:5'/3'-nucleotidase SurE [Candidatus Pelagibacter sp.]MBA4283632.1 5'/3'-nucleotidase SurE [Candidatus Puniceispirillum sp.]